MSIVDRDSFLALKLRACETGQNFNHSSPAEHQNLRLRVKHVTFRLVTFLDEWDPFGQWEKPSGYALAGRREFQQKSLNYHLWIENNSINIKPIWRKGESILQGKNNRGL